MCTIGSWDILHEGHVAYLKEAREQGDVLVVGVDSDEAYKFYKKESAFYPEVDRQAIVAALRYVDYVTIVRDVSAEGEWAMDLVRTIEPDVFVCNNNTYPPEQRTRLADLSGAVRSLPFHDSPRSVDASVNLKRAGRMSHSLMSLIPTKRQWRRWSLPSKLTAVSAYVGILGVLLAVIVLLSTGSFQSTTPSAEQLDCSSPTVKTIVNEKIAIPRPGCYAVDTPNGIPSADLTAIDCKPGDVFILLAAHDDRTVIIRAWTSGEFSLDCQYDRAELECLQGNIVVERDRSSGCS